MELIPLLRGTTGLSQREEQIFWEAARGLTDKEISAKLRISPGTTRTYWERIRKRVGAKNRAEVLGIVLERLYHDSGSQSSLRNLFETMLERSSLGFAVLDESIPSILYVNAAMKRACLERLRALHPVSAADFAETDYTSVLQSFLEDCPYQGRSGLVRGTDLYLGTRHLNIDARKLTLMQISRGDLSMESPRRGARNFYRALLEDQAHAVLILARSGMILFTSLEARDMLRRTRSETIARRFQELCAEPQEALDALRDTILEHGCTLDLVLKDFRGTRFRLTVEMTNRFDDHDVRGIFVLLSIPGAWQEGEVACAV